MTHEVPDIVTPCCGAPVYVLTTWSGGYAGGDSPSEICCEGAGCMNSWTPEGKSDEYNRMTPGKGATVRQDDNKDYRGVFGREPEDWRGPLGALRLTLAGDPDKVDVVRAQHEVEELVRVLNGVKEQR